jgi:Zn-dependent protease with chaperone function
MNRMKTLVLLATLTALLLWAGQALAGQAGFVVALVVAAAMNFGAYWWSDTIVLRMYGARPLAAWSRHVPMAAGSPATAHLFIVNPFAGGALVRLFSTHPPIEERVERLEALARREVPR